MIVLGIAAIVGSIARPPESDDPAEPADPVAAPKRQSRPSADAGPSRALRTIEIPAGARRQPAKLEQGRPATLIVHVGQPAQVEIPSLGLVQSGEPLTPARFDLLVSSPGSHSIRIQPASLSAPRRIPATLEIVPSR